MASAQEVQDEIMGTNPPAGHHETPVHENGPTPLRAVAKTVQDKVSRTVREITLWLPRRALKDIDLGVDKPRKVDTTLGHAIDGASFGRINYKILAKIADKLDVDISDLLAE